MKTLTADTARALLARMKENATHSEPSIHEGYTIQALEIALPVLEGRIASSALPKEVFSRLYDQYLNGVICGEGNKSAAKDFLDACVIALYDSQPQPCTPQIDNDVWIEWKAGYMPESVRGDRVQVRYASGETEADYSGFFNWGYGAGDLVIAYRVIENNGREG